MSTSSSSQLVHLSTLDDSLHTLARFYAFDICFRLYLFQETRQTTQTIKEAEQLVRKRDEDIS